MIILELKPYNYHAPRLKAELQKLGVKCDEGSLEIQRFSDGEVYHRIISNVRNGIANEITIEIKR